MTCALSKNTLVLAVVCLCFQRGSCWSNPHSKISTQSYESVRANVSEKIGIPPAEASTRRDLVHKVSLTLLGGITAALTVDENTSSSSSLFSLVRPKLANAESVPSIKDLSRLQRGHARVQYLLQNWATLTEVCDKGIMSDMERKQTIRTQGGGGGSCDKTPLKVQDYLGYKSTEDPLFKVDKLMLKAAPLVDPDDFENYLNAVESYREKADQGSMMAYTSSWGEANPNGGKDIIDEYLDRTKDEVVATEKLLRKIMGYLNLEVIPPSIALR